MSELTVPEKESRRKYSYERKKVRENDHMRKKISEEKCYECQYERQKMS